MSQSCPRGRAWSCSHGLHAHRQALSLRSAQCCCHHLLLRHTNPTGSTKGGALGPPLSSGGVNCVPQPPGSTALGSWGVCLCQGCIKQWWMFQSLGCNTFLLHSSYWGKKTSLESTWLPKVQVAYGLSSHLFCNLRFLLMQGLVHIFSSTVRVEISGICYWAPGLRLLPFSC